MTHAIRFHQTGAPGVLLYEEAAASLPGPGEVQVRLRAIGVNFLDTLFRRGLLPASLPSGLGHEGAGDVAAIGPGVAGFAVGQRVAFGVAGMGAYAEMFNVHETRLVALPDALSYETGAAIMMKGLTAQYLVRRILPVGPSTSILVHAAAGGVGAIACQWAHSLGATVIGVVGSPEKSAYALAHGCAHVIEHPREDIAARVREFTNGNGVHAVFDSVGRAVFEASLDCLAPFGYYVNFGAASGAPPPIAFEVLGAKGGLRATKTSVWQYAADPDRHAESARELLSAVTSGAIRVDIQHRFTLAEACAAHEALENRRTMGPVVLLPQ